MRRLRDTVRRISATFKDVPGGQLLGRTRDYTQRLLDFSLLGGGVSPNGKNGKPHPQPLPTAVERGATRGLQVVSPSPRRR